MKMAQQKDVKALSDSENTNSSKRKRTRFINFSLLPDYKLEQHTAMRRKQINNLLILIKN